MEYKGYLAEIEIDEESDLLHGRVINTRDLITFESDSLPELRKEFINSVEDYLSFCAERGSEPERPYSGKLLLRMRPERHRAIASSAAKAGMSLNAWIIAKLDEEATRENRAEQQPSHAGTWTSQGKGLFTVAITSDPELPFSSPEEWSRSISGERSGIGGHASTWSSSAKGSLETLN